MRVLRLLLVEDNDGDVMLVRLALKERAIPHEMFVISNGSEAQKAMAHLGDPGGIPLPDLLLIDLNLPAADGVEVLREFRGRPQCAHTPVLVISSSDPAREGGRLEEFHVSEFFRKPSDLDEFLKLGVVIERVSRDGGRLPASA